MKEALFLDRDGVINHMVLYDNGWDSPQKPEDVRLVDGISGVIGWANENNIPVVEVSNQPGVAKGKMSRKVSDSIEKRVHKNLREEGAVVDKVYICPHHPDAIVPRLRKDCDCRKPKPGLIFRAAEELNINLGRSIMLGDKAPDIIAGKAAGIKTIIYLHDEDEQKKISESRKVKANYRVRSMEEALEVLKDFFKLT